MSLPEGFEVGKWLSLNGSSIESLPDKLVVPGDFNARFCRNLRKLPDVLEVGGRFETRGSEIIDLPSRLIVGTDLNFNTTHLVDRDPLMRLPSEYMEIKGNLDASALWNPIWPKKTIIHGDLILRKGGDGVNQYMEGLYDLIELFGGHDHDYIRSFLDVKGEIKLKE